MVPREWPDVEVVARVGKSCPRTRNPKRDRRPSCVGRSAIPGTRAHFVSLAAEIGVLSPVERQLVQHATAEKIRMERAEGIAVIEFDKN